MAKSSQTAPKLSADNDAPERIFDALAKATSAALDGLPIDAIGAAMTRARAVCAVLIGQLDCGEVGNRLSDAVLCDLAWTVQGMCAEVETLVGMALCGGDRSDD